MNQTSGLLIDIRLGQYVGKESILTLGPAGTSSEAAARHLGSQLAAHHGYEPDIKLYDRYEEAGEALRNDVGSLLLVANAYAGINQFYMDRNLALAGAFVFDTPQYGLAAHPAAQLSRRVRIVSHPAPVPLIDQLISPELTVEAIKHTDSTSAAAAAAEKGEAELALTTAPAAEQHGLVFVSPTRNIRMLWSVFIMRKEAIRPVGRSSLLN